jgi:hypothetical protein
MITKGFTLYYIEKSSRSWKSHENAASPSAISGNRLARAVEADREQSLTRLRLVVAVPALMARQALAEGKNRALYQRVLAACTGRPAGDIQLRLVAAGLSAALSEASRY